MFFHDFDTISEVVQRALDNNTKIEIDNNTYLLLLIRSLSFVVL
jgi:hypothetical protein